MRRADNNSAAGGGGGGIGHRDRRPIPCARAPCARDGMASDALLRRGGPWRLCQQRSPISVSDPELVPATGEVPEVDLGGAVPALQLLPDAEAAAALFLPWPLAFPVLTLFVSFPSLLVLLRLALWLLERALSLRGLFSRLVSVFAGAGAVAAVGAAGASGVAVGAVVGAAGGGVVVAGRGGVAVAVCAVSVGVEVGVTLLVPDGEVVLHPPRAHGPAAPEGPPRGEAVRVCSAPGCGGSGPRGRCRRG